MCVIKMKDEKYHIARTVSKSNQKIVEIGKINTLNTYIHVRSHMSLSSFVQALQ
jgi:hypothetical protein